MSRVILWSDNHNFPSLPLMKISAYHKSRGDEVKLYDVGMDHCDILYKSKVFSFTDDLMYHPQCDTVVEGGTGYAMRIQDGKEMYFPSFDSSLPIEIECQYPDYDLYPEFSNKALGFLTRGCCNDCGFCIVSKKEGRTSRRVAELSEFWRGQSTIKLLDGNLLACNEREMLIKQLIDSKAWVDFTQGLDARIVTDDIARLLCQVKIDIVHFAFDSMRYEKEVVRGLEIFRKHFVKTDRHCKVYILTNFNTTHEEDVYRVRRVIELGYQPFVMIYCKGTHSRFLTDLSRWANSPRLYRKCSFAEYVPRVDGRSCKDLYGVEGI